MFSQTRHILSSSPSLPLPSNSSQPSLPNLKIAKEDFLKEWLNCKTRDIKYVDIDFPGIESSFYGKDCPQQKMIEEKISWRRIEEMFKGENIGLFEGKLLAQDIKTGLYIKTYFLYLKFIYIN